MAAKREDVWERLRRAHAELMACALDYEDDELEAAEPERPKLALIHGGA